jgi:outer membrane beta-barrel protein
MKTASTLLATALVLTASAPAFARKSPLDGQPDVRNKYELRLKRFEIAPTFEATVQADYKHTISGGLKLEYHLTDSLSIGGLIFFGTGLDTALTESVSDSLVNPDDPVAPSREDFKNALNTMPMHGGVGATFTPWFGKLNLFSKLYLAFDIYVSGGFGFAQLESVGGSDDCKPTQDGVDLNMNPEFDDPRNDDPCNSGFRPGIQVGAGMHIFMNKWIALDLSFRDYFFTDNPSGGDFNADRRVDSDDPRFLGHLFFGLGISFYLPPKVKISN